MEPRSGERTLHPAWWALILVSTLVGTVALSMAMFNRAFASYVPVTLVSSRAGLVMESGAKVKLRGVQVGQVDSISPGTGAVSLKLDLFPDAIRYIPANVDARIRATTAFGAKYVELTYPTDPSSQRISAGAVLHSDNVSIEVNTVFQNLVGVLTRIDVSKLNSVLGAFAEGVRGQGEAIGQATTDANQVLMALNPRADTMRRDWQSLKGFSDAYGAAAGDLNLHVRVLAHVNLGPFLGEDDEGVGAFDGDVTGKSAGGERRCREDGCEFFHMMNLYQN